ncbi:MAG: helix-turn-helix transcriptional regulator [Bacillota bacterium]|nr:helix-turn-helix transcriptional regulator [Bacillota bacterium]
MRGNNFLGDEKLNRIKEIMKRRGITQEELSHMTGISQTTLSRIVNERKSINLETAKKISKALVYPIEYLWPD